MKVFQYQKLKIDPNSLISTSAPTPTEIEKKTLRRKGWTLVGMGYFEKSLDNYIKLNKISGDDMFYENSLSFFSISQLAHSYIRLNQYQVGIDI